jgi:SlyX protein
MSTDRLTQLEERAAHLERMVEDLSGVVARQDRDIHALQRRVGLLLEREADREAQALLSAPANEKPPHY